MGNQVFELTGLLSKTPLPVLQASNLMRDQLLQA
jgi:hypothetical protein